MTRKFSIVIFASSIGGGGAERTISTLTGALRNDFDFSLLLREPQREFIFPLPSSIPIFDMNIPLLLLIFRLRSFLKKAKPDLVFSVFTKNNILLLVATWGMRRRPKIIISERTTYSVAASQLKNPLKRIVASVFVPLCIRMLYPRASAVIAVSEGVAKDLRILAPNLKNIQVVQNPIDREYISQASRDPAPLPFIQKGPLVVAVGRLIVAKDYPTLLRAMTFLENNIELAILGEGPERGNLISLAEKLDISERVHFLGFQNNPYAYMAKADVFVLPSIREGFPNALVEAMTLGIPVVATNCPSGPGEIIQHLFSGVLVSMKNPEQLASAICSILEDFKFREALALNGSNRSRDFDLEIIIQKYKNLIATVLDS